MDTYVSEKTLIGDLVKDHPETIDVMYMFGMHCVGCHASVDETLEEACAVHNIDPKVIIDAINERIKVYREYMQ